MALIGGAYPDSGGNESYPRQRMARPTFAGAGSAPPVQNAGLPGGTAGPDPTPPANPAPTPTPNPTPAPPTRNFNWLSGFDQGKFNDQTHQSAKYQMGRIFSQYDPRQGVTDPILQALNGLGFADFYGSGQNLGLRRVTSAGQAAGLDPHDFMGDFVQGFHSNTPLWQYDAWQPDAPLSQLGAAVGTPQGASQGQGFGFESLMPLLTSIVNATGNQQAPSAGMDPAQLSQLLAGLQPPTPIPAPTLQTQAPPMLPSAGGGTSPAIAPMLAGGGAPTAVEDPFTAWLRSMLGRPQ